MKRLVFIIVALMAIVTAEAGKQYTKKGVQYDVLTATTAKASLTAQAHGEVTILEAIKIGRGLKRNGICSPCPTRSSRGGSMTIV